MLLCSQHLQNKVNDQTFFFFFIMHIVKVSFIKKNICLISSTSGTSPDSNSESINA